MQRHFSSNITKCRAGYRYIAFMRIANGRNFVVKVHLLLATRERERQRGHRVHALCKPLTALLLVPEVFFYPSASVTVTGIKRNIAITLMKYLPLLYRSSLVHRPNFKVHYNLSSRHMLHLFALKAIYLLCRIFVKLFIM